MSKSNGICKAIYPRNSANSKKGKLRNPQREALSYLSKGEKINIIRIEKTTYRMGEKTKRVSYKGSISRIFK